MLEAWKQRARVLEREVYALYFAGRDPRVQWYAKALAIAIVAYAFSPIDLIPDFIPVLGLLDDLLLIPLGVMAVRAMIPEEVMATAKPRSWIAAGVIVALWAAVAAGFLYWLWQRS